MEIPPSILSAYESARLTAESLQHFAGTRLAVIAAENDWLVSHRIKSIESCMSKLDQGTADSIAEMHDLFAASIVVPTRSEVELAVEKIIERFTVKVKSRPATDANIFKYDDVHLLGSLQAKVSPVSVPGPVLNSWFEIQIHTGLQYAWWQATHDQIYKNATQLSVAWPIERVSSQARATLELVDGIISDFSRASGNVTFASGGPSGPGMTTSQEILSEIVELWPVRSRPADLIRFARTIENVSHACGVELDNILSRMTQPDIAALIKLDRVTAVQVVLVALSRICGATFGSHLKDAGVRILVTDELIACEAAMGTLPQEVTIQP